jgi:hypothetical protein
VRGRASAARSTPAFSLAAGCATLLLTLGSGCATLLLTLGSGCATLLLTLGSGCATLANGEAGTDATPSLAAGPFRMLGAEEVGQGYPPPVVLEVDALALEGLAVVPPLGVDDALLLEGYVAATLAGPDGGPARGLARARSTDGRTFSRDVEPALLPAFAWEGSYLAAPSVARASSAGLAGDLLLAYEAEGGLAVVRLDPSDDPPTLTNAEAPSLTLGELSFEATALRSPGLVALPDGTLRLFYAADLPDGREVIGVATSDDGRPFEDLGVVLAGPAGSRFGSPHAVLADAGDRERLLVYFTAAEQGARQEIRLAGRFVEAEGESLEVSESAMYRPSGDLAPREPCVVRLEAYSLLFVTERTTESNEAPRIVAGVTPADATLPPPSALP